MTDIQSIERNRQPNSHRSNQNIFKIRTVTEEKTAELEHRPIVIINRGMFDIKLSQETNDLSTFNRTSCPADSFHPNDRGYGELLFTQTLKPSDCGRVLSEQMYNDIRIENGTNQSAACSPGFYAAFEQPNPSGLASPPGFSRFQSRTIEQSVLLLIQAL